jgi:hypothetical protein
LLLPARSFGKIILTTSAGIMDHEEARRKHVGGLSSLFLCSSKKTEGGNMLNPWACVFFSRYRLVARSSLTSTRRVLKSGILLLPYGL